MNEWIKKHRDTILIVSVGAIATAVVAGVTYKVTTDYANATIKSGMRQASMIAAEAGVLDQIIAHQANLDKIVK